MKTLKDFIKESQEINESLLGDIIRKLLDTSLSWIGSSAKWVADHIVKATSELWNTAKNLTDKEWDILRRRSGYRGYGAPRDEYEYAKIMTGLHKGKNYGERLKYINDTFGNSEYNGKHSDDWVLTLRIEQMKWAFEVLSDPTAEKEYKETAMAFLNDIKKRDKNGKYGLTKQIDDFLKDYEKHNNKK